VSTEAICLVTIRSVWPSTPIPQSVLKSTDDLVM